MSPKVDHGELSYKAPGGSKVVAHSLPAPTAASADVKNESDVRSTIAEVATVLGGIDALINNAENSWLVLSIL